MRAAWAIRLFMRCMAPDDYAATHAAMMELKAQLDARPVNRKAENAILDKIEASMHKHPDLQIVFRTFLFPRHPRLVVL